MPPLELYFIALVATARLIQANSASDLLYDDDVDANSDYLDYEGSDEPPDRATILDGINCPKQMGKEYAPWKLAVLCLYQGNSDLRKTIRELDSFGTDAEPMFADQHIDRFPLEWGFDLKKPTLIFMAGFMQKLTHPYLERVRSNYDKLKAARGGVSPINMIFFDWYPYYKSLLGLFPQYGKAVADVDHLGRLLAYFIKRLVVEHNYKLDKVHIVTHSLSTHIGGAAGRKLIADGLGQVDQITAIDPTGVCFHNLSWDPGDQFGLQATDAKLVLATHYNMDFLGAKRPIGGVDIFINGGKSQNEMDEKFSADYTASEQFLKQVGLGDHARSVWHDSWQVIPRDCQDVAYECESLAKFQRGQCASCGANGESCAMIGAMATTALGLRQSEVSYKPNTRLFITTGRNSFCLHYYQVVAELREGTSTKVLEHFLLGQAAYEIDYDLTIRPKFASENSPPPGRGPEFTQLLRLNTNDLRFRCKLKENSLDVFNAIKSISINYMSNISKDERAKRSFRYCPGPASSQELVAC